MALAGGVDLVLELPLPWVLTSAEGFARGAVALLEALGCVDTLSFGSECGDTAALEQAAVAMEQPRYLQLVKYRMENGVSAAEAQQKALAETTNAKTAALLNSPNNILGIEYIKALHACGSSIRPFTIPRNGAEHDALYPIGDMASASYLRTLAREEHWSNAAPFLPRYSYDRMTAVMAERHAPADEQAAERALLALLRTRTPDELAQIAGVSEGLENRLYTAIRQATSLPQLVELIKTRRYPLTRVRRLIWSAALGLPASLASGTPPYIRVLGMNERGREILTAAKQAGMRLPLLTRVSQQSLLDDRGRAIRELEARASDLYALTLPEPLPCGTDLTDGIVRTDV